MFQQLINLIKCRPLTVVIGNSLEYGFLTRSIEQLVQDLPDLSIEVMEDLPGDNLHDAQTILRSKYHELSGTGQRIIYLIARDNAFVDASLERLVGVYRQPYPTAQQIQTLYLERGVEISDDNVAMARGITYGELELVLTEAKYAPDFWAYVDGARKEKLEMIGLKHEPPPDIPDVAGLDGLMSQLPRIKAGFSPAALAAGLKYPKGFMIAGVPGAGKTLAARVIASKLRLPMLSLGVDLVCDRGVEPLKLMLAAAEQCSPCILYIDELDKFFGGVGQSQILGLLCTWLNDRTTPVFCIATLNRLNNVPAELKRAGRWDGIYGIGMPDHNQLIAQFRLLLGLKDSRYNDPSFISESDWRLLTDQSMNCVGAEVAGIVNQLVLSMVMEGAQLPLKIDFNRVIAEAKGFQRQYALNHEAIVEMEKQIDKVCRPAAGAEQVITNYVVDYH